MTIEIDVQAKISELVTTHPVVLFMKGSKDFPVCGFSGRVIQILSELNATFLDVNVLEDDAIRQGIKIFANWPTIPQLYVNGEFIGGCDIMNEMFESGELKRLLESTG
jgi:monothiol glutaredoxin